MFSLGTGVSLFVVIVISLIVVSVLLRRGTAKANSRALDGALENHEEIIDGQLWSGRDAEVLASERVPCADSEDAICVAKICRTQRNNWFEFVVSVEHGEVTKARITPLDEETARHRLERHRDVYFRLFGTPTLA